MLKFRDIRMITSSHNPSIDLHENGSAREW